MSTVTDAPVTRQESTTNQALDEHRCTPRCTRCDGDTGLHCRIRLEIIWTKEFAEAEVANHAVDAVPLDPHVRVSEPVEPAAAARGQPAAMEMNTDGTRDIGGNATNDQTGARKLVRNPVVESDGGASCQLDENQLQPMDVSLNRNATTTATKQRAGTQLTTNNVESCIGGLRSVAGHQDERAESMLPIEAMKFSMNTVTDVSHQCEHYTGMLGDRDKHVAKYFGVIRRGKK